VKPNLQYAVITDKGFLTVKAFRLRKLAKTEMGRLFLELLEEKYWSKNLFVKLNFCKGDVSINIWSGLFVSDGWMRIFAKDLTACTVEAVREKFLLSLDEKQRTVNRMIARLTETSVHIAAALTEQDQMTALQFMQANTTHGRVYLPRRAPGTCFWYAINGDRILVVHEILEEGYPVYALEGMTKERFEKERMNLRRFPSVVKGAIKL
jgi:hypothetical protein